jgi:1-deoxy-D-xylulose-5-phosphate reductoisomerase
MSKNGEGGGRRLAVLGSTGSIGRQALEVVERHPSRLEVVALTAHSNLELLREQALRHRPLLLGVTGEEAGRRAQQELAGLGAEVLTGREALEAAASLPQADLVLNAVVGSAGLEATLAALGAGKRLALANKESLVAGGPLVLEALKRGGELIPVDSEHSAVFQCLRGEDPGEVESIILTASGGPFYGRSREELKGVGVNEALAHPTWKMGRKISVDSATLMNKGLEVIEAHFLFGLPYERIEVVAHPQSVIHSMVRFRDGAVMAQLSLPDMRLPISYALSFPERWEPAWRRTDLSGLGGLTFGELDRETFVCLDLAYRAGEAGGSAPAVLNAANEAAVASFLEGRIGFTDIGDIVKAVLERHRPAPLSGLRDVREAEREAAERTAVLIGKR